MNRADVQRLLAEEFERRGWEYDLGTAKAIADAVEATGSVDAQTLARLADGSFLARARATRAQLASAIEAALAGRRSIGREVRMKLLFLAAGPMDEQRLRLTAEHRDIKERLRSASARAHIEVEESLAARPTDLVDQLNRARPSILHLAGHGGPLGLALEDDHGNASDVTTDQLLRLVSSADENLRLVVLNSCESAHQAAPIVQHVDAAIGMTRTIGDEAARVFAAQLYSSLGEGVTLSRAFEQARLQISLAGIPEDQTPKLFVKSGRSADNMVFV